jgi:hypothetical protein
MPTNRRPVSAQPRFGQITPAAVAVYRRLRAWDGKCVCPLEAPYFGNFDNTDAACMARYQLYLKQRETYEAARARCQACPAAEREHELLLRELRAVLKPWQTGIEDFPDVVAALDAAIAVRRKRRRVVRERVAFGAEALDDVCS